jgi:hypothetical protein
MFTKVLHEVLTSKNKPVKVYAVHPGVIKTNVWSKYWFTHFTSIFSGFVGKVRQLLKRNLERIAAFNNRILFFDVDGSAGCSTRRVRRLVAESGRLEREFFRKFQSGPANSAGP